jgi:hypothetical protein
LLTTVNESETFQCHSSGFVVFNLHGKGSKVLTKNGTKILIEGNDDRDNGFTQVLHFSSSMSSSPGGLRKQ